MQTFKSDVLDRKIRVGAVNYLNTKPLIYGFTHGEMKDEVDLVMEYPSKIAAMLANDEIDVGLVPVTIIPELKEHNIISEYCIGCDGEVGSVCLFSEVPLNKIEKILLDYQSRTSVDLLKVLIKQYWKINPVLIATTEDYRKDIKDSTAGLMIGDRALEQRNVSAYKYDLGLEWKNFTGLPFVFAAWISNKKLPAEVITNFNAATGMGLEKINNIVASLQYDVYDLNEYYRRNLVYKLTDRLKNGMHEFLNMVK